MKKEEKIKRMNEAWCSCRVCTKRAGSWFYNACADGVIYGRHGNGKPIFKDQFRSYKTWKHNRKTQWKEK